MDNFVDSFSQLQIHENRREIQNNNNSTPNYTPAWWNAFQSEFFTRKVTFLKKISSNDVYNYEPEKSHACIINFYEAYVLKTANFETKTMSGAQPPKKSRIG
jgi:hypothetical protein